MDWGYWLNEPIYTDKGVMNIQKRKHVLYDFCKRGLLPFLESAGYYSFKTNDELYKTLLNVLFTLYRGKTVLPHQVDFPHGEDHYNMYMYHLDTQAWDRFWLRWSDLQDFEEGAYGEKLRWILPDLLWSWMDFDNSSAIQTLERELIELESQEETKGKDDPYLQENSRRDYHDRHW